MWGLEVINPPVVASKACVFGAERGLDPEALRRNPVSRASVFGTERGATAEAVSANGFRSFCF